MFSSIQCRPVQKMLSRNLLIISVAVVFLATTISSAPVEDKDQDDNNFDADDGEEELSEEEEDDDDSKGQPLKGTGTQQATLVPKGPGVTALPGSSVVGEPPNGQKVNGGSAAQTSFGSSSGSSAASTGANVAGGNGRDSQALPSGSNFQGAVLSVAGHGSSGSKVPGTADTAHSDSVSNGSPSQVSLSHVSSAQEPQSHVSNQMASEQTSSSAFVSSEVQSQPEGPEASTPHTAGSNNDNGDNGKSQTVYAGSQIEAPGSESAAEKAEMETNGNGHKQILNGLQTGHTGLDNFMEGTTPIDFTGVFDSFDTNSNPESTGTDQFRYDFITDLMGGMGNSFTPDPYTDAIDHMGLAFQLDPTGFALDPGQLASSSPAPPGHHVPAETWPDASVQSTVTSDIGAQSSSPLDLTEGADNNGADLPVINGNGRHRPMTDIHKGEQHSLVTHTHSTGILDVKDPTFSPYTNLITDAVVTDVRTQTDMAGDKVTNGQGQMEVTAMADVIYSSRPPDTLGYETNGVTEGVSNRTDYVLETKPGFTDASQTRGSMVQTELGVTGNPMAASSQANAMDTASAEPQGTFRSPNQPGATEQTHRAVPAGEQYHTSGQGPEGAENVELEDTC